jgi:hypothetical protein
MMGRRIKEQLQRRRLQEQGQGLQRRGQSPWPCRACNQQLAQLKHKASLVQAPNCCVTQGARARRRWRSPALAQHGADAVLLRSRRGGRGEFKGRHDCRKKRLKERQTQKSAATRRSSWPQSQSPTLISLSNTGSLFALPSP